MEFNQALVAAARNHARKWGLSPDLVCAMVEQESGWEPWAIRYEPAFFNHYVAPLNLPDTEGRARSFSWGLLQIMGEVARELGFVGHLASLCDPDTGLDWGCRKFSRCLNNKQGDTKAALLQWNGGGNPNYADEVLARLGNYKGE